MSPTYSSGTSTSSSGDGPEHDVGLGGRLLEGQAAGDLEGHVGGVEWNLPSYRVTRMSTTGYLGDQAVLHGLAHAFLDRGDELVGHGPAVELVGVLEPLPRGRGSTSMLQMAYWPWPPDCFTCRPSALTGALNVSL